MVSRLTADDLTARLDDEDTSFTLVDTRQADSFADWHINGAYNIPFDPVEGFDDAYRERVAGIANGDHVVVVCAKGLTSTPFAIHLEEAGYDDVSVVIGGMERWSTVMDTVPIETDDLLLVQCQRRATGCLSYLIGSASTREAAVVDPARSTDHYHRLAQAHDLTISSVIDTHVHADHVSGGPGLAETLDVPYHLGASPSTKHDYVPLSPAQPIDLGPVSIDVIHAPGHTEEMATLLVDDRYLLASDTLFLESVGRTELGFEDDAGAERGADLLYDTLQRFERLDPELMVLPGHVSIKDDISFEEGAPGQPIAATLGELFEALSLLTDDRDDFIDAITSDLPEQPADYETVIAVNSGQQDLDTWEEGAELDAGANNCSA